MGGPDPVRRALDPPTLEPQLVAQQLVREPFISLRPDIADLEFRHHHLHHAGADVLFREGDVHEGMGVRAIPQDDGARDRAQAAERQRLTEERRQGLANVPRVEHRQAARHDAAALDPLLLYLAGAVDQPQSLEFGQHDAVLIRGAGRGQGRWCDARPQRRRRRGFGRDPFVFLCDGKRGERQNADEDAGPERDDARQVHGKSFALPKV